MELTELLEKIESELNSETHRFPLSYTQKADYLFCMYECVCRVSKEEIESLQQRIEALVVTIASQGCTAPVRRLAKKVIMKTLQEGRASRRSENVNEFMKIAANHKFCVSARCTALDVVAGVITQFKTLPAAEELLELNKKALKSNEKTIKVFSVKALEALLSAKSFSSSLAQEALRFLLKTLHEKQPEVSAKGSKALLELVKNFPESVVACLEALVQGCVKGFEKLGETNLVEGLALTLSVHLEPSQPLKSSRKSFEDPPKNVVEVLTCVKSYFNKQTSHNCRTGIVLCLEKVFASHLRKELVHVSDTKIFLDALMNFPRKGSANDLENWRVSELVSWLATKCISTYLSDSQANKVVEYTINKLSTLKPLVHDSGVVEVDPSVRKSTEPKVEIQVSILLRCFSAAMYRVIPDQVLPQYSESLYKPFLSLLSSAKHAKYTSRALVILSERYSSILFNLLSMLLTYTSIAHAELAGLKSEPGENYQEAVNSLEGTCLGFASLIKTLRTSCRGVPPDISNVAFNTVKGMISGEYQGEVIDEGSIFKDSGVAFKIETSIRKCGWMIVEGLVTLGPSWVGAHLTTLFYLWKLPFGRKACFVENELGNQKITQELLHKKAAISSLLAFLRFNQSLLNPHILKVLIAFLGNALEFVYPSKNSSARRAIFEENSNPSELVVFKSKLYECLQLVPFEYLCLKSSVILQCLCGDIVSEKTLVVPDIYEDWLSSEDNYLVKRKRFHPLYELSVTKFQEHLADNWLSKPVAVHWEAQVTRGFVQEQMLKDTLELFSKIFMSSSFNIVNRKKLFGYLSQHLASTIRVKESSAFKMTKVSMILLATLGVLRRLSLDRVIITDLELVGTIRQMLDSAETVPYPLVKRLFSESTIYLCKVMSDPQYIPVFIKELEHRVIISEQDSSVKSGIVMLIGCMYKHFDPSVIEKNELTLGHIIQSIARDPLAGGWGMHVMYKIYSLHGPKLNQVLKATFPMGFYHFCNDYKTEFTFSETMIQLCSKYLQMNPLSEDSLYRRCKLVWEDLFELSDSALSCAAQMAFNQVRVNLKECMTIAWSGLPGKESVEFLEQCLDLGYKIETLEQVPPYELLKMHDVYSEDPEVALSKLRELTKRLVVVAASEDLESCWKMLKSSLTATEEVEGSELGLSALDKKLESSPNEYSYTFTLFTKEFILELVEVTLQFKDKMQSHLEELVSFACNMCTSDYENFKKLGLGLFKKVYLAFSHLKDQEEPDKLLLEIYEAQSSAILRQCLNSPSIEVCILAHNTVLSFLLIPGTSDLSVVSKLVNPILAVLPQQPFVPSIEGYSYQATSKLYYSALLTLAKLMLGSSFKEVLVSYSETLNSHFKALVTDLGVIFTQPKYLLKEHNFMLGYQILEQDHPQMGNIDIFVLALAHQDQDIRMILAFCYSFLFLPYSAGRESHEFQSQQEIDLFLDRRLNLLRALDLLLPQLEDQTCIAEILEGLMLCAEVPHLTHKALVLSCCRHLSRLDLKQVAAIEQFVLANIQQHPELLEECIATWGFCVQKYLEFAFCEVLDEKVNSESYVGPVVKFFDYCVDRTDSVEWLQSFWKSCGDKVFKFRLTQRVLAKWVANGKLQYALDFLGTKKEKDLVKLGYIVKVLGQVITEFSDNSAEVLRRLPESGPLLRALLQYALKVFEVETPSANCQSEALKLLLFVFKTQKDKDTALKSIFPMLLSVYSTNTELGIVKSVSKALHYLASCCPQTFKHLVQQMPPQEKKFLENQLLSSQTAQTPQQPSITLQFKLRRP